MAPFDRLRKRSNSVHTAPDTVDPQGPCPYCGNIAAFSLVGGAVTNYEEGVFAALHGGGQERIPRERVSVLQCQGCGMGVVVVEDQVKDQGKHLVWEGKHWWPPATTSHLDPSVPAAAKASLEEGMRCQAAHAPRAAAVMYRLALAQMAIDIATLEPTKARIEKNLSDGLEQMSKDGDLRPDLWEWVQELRAAGNAGAHHRTEDPVTDEEAESLRALLGELIDAWYTAPARIRRAKGQPRPSSS